MSDTLILITKILAMFLVMAVGWLVRRRALLNEQTTALLSRFTTDVALPSLIFWQMLNTVDAAALRAEWAVPLFAAGILIVGHIVGWLLWRAFASAQQAPTFIFVVGIANWIYLPWPIVEALYPADGVRLILLSNVGVQVVLWTLGVATLHGGRLDARALRSLLTNPGLLATGLGILLTLTLPGRPWQNAGGAMWTQLGVQSPLQAMKAIGDLTIPLSLLVTGAQLGGIRLTGAVPVRPLIGVVLLRLLVVPILIVGLVWLAVISGAIDGGVGVMVGLVIAMMPVAVSCSILAERFKQDANLAAQSILYTTLLSIVTVPALFSLAKLLVTAQ